MNFTAHIIATFCVTSQKSDYDVIFGRDLLQEFGINLDFQNNFVGWTETKIPMKSIDYKMRTNFAIQESKILDVRYETANLKEIATKLKYFNSDEQFLIHILLKKYENMFDGTLGNYTGTEYKFGTSRRSSTVPCKTISYSSFKT